ncbi:hypothetical protein I204_07346 [Kwoniella mangroviensis CBS 8886]|nr:hypothetical protein I204_07346 [Kwoniella mangroviensis CBS 8886]
MNPQSINDFLTGEGATSRSTSSFIVGPAECMDEVQCILSRSATFLDKVSNVYDSNEDVTVLGDVPEVASVITSALEQAREIHPILRRHAIYGEELIRTTEASRLHNIYSALSTIENQVKSMNSKFHAESSHGDASEFKKRIKEVRTVKDLINEGRIFDIPRIQEICHAREYQQFIHPPTGNTSGSQDIDTSSIFYPESTILREGSRLLDARNPNPSYKPAHIIHKISIVPGSLDSKHQIISIGRGTGDLNLADFERWEPQARKPRPVSWFDWMEKSVLARE